MPSRFRATWPLPIAGPPVRDGWVAAGDGLVTDVGSGAAPDAIDLGRAVILHARINTHTHLELAYLHQRIPSGGPFLAWSRRLMAARREHPDPAGPAIVGAAR